MGCNESVPQTVEIQCKDNNITQENEAEEAAQLINGNQSLSSRIEVNFFIYLDYYFM